MKLNPNNVATRYHRAIILANTDPLKAIGELNLVETASNDYVTPLIYSVRGLCYGKTREYDKAIQDFTTAIRFDPTDVANYINRAVTFEKLTDFQNAAKDYAVALEVNPEEKYAKERLVILEEDRVLE